MFFKVYLISLFSDMGAIQILLPFLDKLHFQKMVTAVSLGGLFLDGKLMGNIARGFKSREGKTLIFLMVWMVISVPLSVYPGESFTFLTQSFWKTIVMTLLVIAYVSSKESFEKVIWTYILAVGFLSTLTVIASIGGRLAIDESVYDANDTALQFVMALPFVIWKYRSSRGAAKILTGAICLVLLFGIIETKSRGGFLGLIAVVAVTAYQIGKVEKGGFFKMLTLSAVICVLIFYFGGAEYLDRMSTIFNPSSDYNVTSETGRINIWSRGIDMMLQNPVLGVGIACFITAEGRLYADTGSRWNAAHNSFIQIGAELGFPGLLAFCYLAWSSIKSIRRILSTNGDKAVDPFKKVTSNTLIGSWVGFIVGGFFLSAAYTGSFFFLLALSMAFIAIERVPKQQKNPLMYSQHAEAAAL